MLPNEYSWLPIKSQILLEKEDAITIENLKEINALSLGTVKEMSYPFHTVFSYPLLTDTQEPRLVSVHGAETLTVFMRFSVFVSAWVREYASLFLAVIFTAFRVARSVIGRNVLDEKSRRAHEMRVTP